MKTLVILASYNGETYIQAQIDSILNQKDIDVKIHVFDDQSIDKTIEIVNNNFSEIIDVTINNKPSGSAAHNFLNAITSLNQEIIQSFDYFALADQDDIWLENKLCTAIKNLQSQKSSLFCSNLELWDQKSNKSSLIRKDYTQKKFDFLFEGGSAGCTYVFDASFCKTLQLDLSNSDYNNWKFLSHDWLIYFIARINKLKVTIDSQPLIKYRIHSNNVHGHMNKLSLKAIRERIKILNDGWYAEQSYKFIKLTRPNSNEEYIYRNFNKSYFSRVMILFRYNFQLIRSNKKFIQFFVLNLVFFKNKNV